MWYSRDPRARRLQFWPVELVELDGRVLHRRLAGGSPGNESPGATVQGEPSALDSKTPVTLCNYELPSVQAQCKTGVSQESASQLPTATDPAIGWVAIDGTKALIATTGKYCTPNQGQTPGCFTNTDPTAGFTSSKTFAQLWSDTVANTSSSTYSLAPCEEISGSWYVYAAS